MCELKTPSSELWPPTLTRLEISRDVRVGDSTVGISPPTSIGLEREAESVSKKREKFEWGRNVYANKFRRPILQIAFNFFLFLADFTYRHVNSAFCV